MKKLLLIALLLVFVLSGCTNMNGSSFDPMESSIFRMAEVEKGRITVDRLEVNTTPTGRTGTGRTHPIPRTTARAGTSTRARACT